MVVRATNELESPHGAAPARHGHYKVFLGMAAGVGKTYRMLQEGKAEADAGRDVVIGYLEPHGRLETSAQAEGLERVPRRRVTYRGTTLEEMDLPGLLARAPELALIDELAHTNAPGLRARKALRGHRGRARRRHRRPLDAERPAPGDPQRPGRRADRRAGARDGARRRAGSSRRGRAHRPHSGGAARPAAGREGLRGRAAHSERAEQLLQDREPGRAARGRAAAGRGGGGEQAAGPRGRDRAGRAHARLGGAAGRRRAASRAHNAAAAITAHRAPGMALGAAPRRRARSAVGHLPRGRARGRGARAAGSASAPRLRARGAPARRARGSGRRGRQAGGRRARHHLRPHGHAASARSGSSLAHAGPPFQLLRALPGIDLRIVANRADRDPGAAARRRGGDGRAGRRPDRRQHRTDRGARRLRRLRRPRPPRCRAAGRCGATGAVSVRGADALAVRPRFRAASRPRRGRRADAVLPDPGPLHARSGGAPPGGVRGGAADARSRGAACRAFRRTGGRSHRARSYLSPCPRPPARARALRPHHRGGDVAGTATGSARTTSRGCSSTRRARSSSSARATEAASSCRPLRRRSRSSRPTLARRCRTRGRPRRAACAAASWRAGPRRPGSSSAGSPLVPPRWPAGAGGRASRAARATPPVCAADPAPPSRPA